MALTDKYIKTGVFNASQNGNSEGSAYEAGNAAEFDHILRDVLNGENFHIHIAAGEYRTLGLRHDTTQQSDDAGAIYGWHVRSNWTITGQGEGVTIIKLDALPSFITTGQKWTVIGSLADVADVTIENMTVDGNWLNLVSPPVGIAVHCVLCLTNGPVAYRKLEITGFYGYNATQAECFALCCGSKQPVDPQELEPTWLAVFDRCTVHHGHGDYCVGIAAFNAGPSIIDGCHVYSLANLYSGAIQANGGNIQITNNIVRDCVRAFYVDTGNIRNLLIERNHFASNGPNVIYSNPPYPASVLIRIRQNDVGGDFDGVYLDVPIRPVGNANPLYRMRLYFHRIASPGFPESTYVPPLPADGILVPCPFVRNATRADLEGTGTGNPIVYHGAIADGLDQFPWGVSNNPARLANFRLSNYGAAELLATSNGESIRHSLGAPSVSDESKVYIQVGWAWTNWKIRNNYLELAFGAANSFAQQFLIVLHGNGSTDRDYHIADNVGRFTGTYHNIPMFGMDSRGLDRVALLNNVFDYRAAGEIGKVQIYKAESPDEFNLIPIDILYRFGNRTLSARPHRDLSDNFHRTGAQQALAGAAGTALTGTELKFSSATAITGTDTRFLDELRPGDLLSTNATGGIQTSNGLATGPFYVRTVTSQTPATLTRAVAINPDPNPMITATLRRYRGPVSYAGADGVARFNVLHDGSMVLGDIPADIGLAEAYLKGNVALTGRLRLGDGSAPAPALAFSAGPSTGLYLSGSDSLSLAVSGIERARLSAAGLQLAVQSLGSGTTLSATDTILLRDEVAGTLALRRLANAQSFRIYGTFTSIYNYRRANLAWVGGDFQIEATAAGSGTAGLGHLVLKTAAARQIRFLGGAASSLIWSFDADGHLLAADAARMIKWGTYSINPAIKATAEELQIRRADGSGAGALACKLLVVPKVAAHVIDPSENGRCFTNAGASGLVVFTLPASALHPGFHCYFVVEAAAGLAIHPPDATTTIRIGSDVTLPGADLSCAIVGNAVHLVCTGTTRWVALRRAGDWF